MELSKEKNGKLLQDMLVIGTITVKKGLAFSFIKMEINMKECGREIEDMVKGLNGEMKMGSWEENIQETGMKIECMAEEHSSIKTEIDMMVTG